jgi:tape measure domain-containing protein
MADKVGSVYIEIQAKMGSLERDLKQLEGRLGGVDGKAQKTSSSMMSMGKLIAGSFITGALIGLGKAALKASADMEQNRVAFTTMLGSAEKATSLLKEMTDFAASTPFELPQVVEGGKKLLAFGFAAKDIIPTLTKLGDVSAALSIPIGELSDIYGKMKVQGVIQAEELNQLAGRGIPIFTELAKVMGVNADEVKKLGSQGKISFKELEKSFTNMTAEGSQFGGMMDAQSRTLAGKWSNFNDALGKTFVLMGDSASGGAGAFVQLMTAFVNKMNDTPSGDGVIGHWERQFQRYRVTLDGTEDKINDIVQMMSEENFQGLSKAMEDAGNTSSQMVTNFDALKSQYGEVNAAAAIYTSYLNGDIKITAEQLKAVENIVNATKVGTNVTKELADQAKNYSENLYNAAIPLNNNISKMNEFISVAETAGKTVDKVKPTPENIAAWKKLKDEAKRFNDEIAQQADSTDDPVVKVQREIDALNKGYQRNKDLKAKGVIDESQYNLNVLNITEARIKKEEELEKAKFERNKAMALGAVGAARELAGQFVMLAQMSASNDTARIDNKLKEQQDALTAQYDMEVEAINNSTATEEEKNAKLKALDEKKARDEKSMQTAADKEKRKIARDAAKLQQKLAIFDVLIRTPQAAMAAFSSLAMIPFVGPALGAAAAAATLAMGAYQIKLISEQPLPALAQGGIIPAVPGGQQFLAGEAGSAEAVIPLNDATLGRLAGMINSAGGGGGGAMNITLNVDGETLGQWFYNSTKNGQTIYSKNGMVA